MEGVVAKGKLAAFFLAFFVTILWLVARVPFSCFELCCLCVFGLLVHCPAIVNLRTLIERSSPFIK